MAINWEHPLRQPLAKAAPRPDAKATAPDKKNYAEKLSRALAELVADALRSRKTFKSITPTKQGKGHEAATQGDGGKKKLDVRLVNNDLGLVFSASIKTYSFQDYSPKNDTFGRFQKNVVRNDMELRAEADIIHRRQPYATMVALFFMHEGATTDGENKHSSFAHAVFTLRKRAGRRAPDDLRYDRFEKVYIGLFNPDNPTDGSVRFFDVEQPPPKNGMPKRVIGLREVVDQIDLLVRVRNESVFEYEDGAEDDDVDLGTVSVADLTEALLGEEPDDE